MEKLLSVGIVTMFLGACANTASEQNVSVYINNGAIQCESDGKTGTETAMLLTAQGIEVSQNQCGHLSNIAVVAMCGGPATNINVHQIRESDLAKAQALGFENVETLKQDNHKGYDVSDCNE